MPKVLKVRDHTDSNTINMNKLFDIPFRLLICAKSGHGKSNLLTNILCNDEFGYNKIFKSPNIHIFSPTIKQDRKLEIIKEFYDIEDDNLHDDYSDELIMEIYEGFIQEFDEDRLNSKKPSPKLIILDDLSSSGVFSKNRYNAISVLFCNSRKYLVSLVLLSQAYTHVTPTIRNNASAIIVFNTNLQSLDAIEQDFNYLDSKKQFIKMFRNNVKTKFDFLVINFSNNYEDLYLDSDFEPILPPS